jgi:hypothetical protein
MPTLKKSVHYRARGTKPNPGKDCAIIPLEDREVSWLIYSQYEEIERPGQSDTKTMVE